MDPARTASGSSINEKRKPTYAWQLLRASCEADYEMILGERKTYLANSCDLGNNPKLLAEWMALIEELDNVARQNLGVDNTGYAYFSAKPKEDSRKRSKSFVNLFKVAKPLDTNATPMPAPRRPRSNSFRGFFNIAFSKRRTGTGSTAPASNNKSSRRYMPPAPSSSGNTYSDPFKDNETIRYDRKQHTEEMLNKQRKLQATLQFYKAKRGSEGEDLPPPEQDKEEVIANAVRREAEARFSAERATKRTTQHAMDTHENLKIELLSTPSHTVANAAVEVLLELKMERAQLGMPTSGTAMAWV